MDVLCTHYLYLQLSVWWLKWGAYCYLFPSSYHFGFPNIPKQLAELVRARVSWCVSFAGSELTLTSSARHLFFCWPDRLCSMLRCSGPLTWPRLAWRRRSARCKRDSWCSWAKLILGLLQFQDFYVQIETTQTYTNIVHTCKQCRYSAMEEIWKNPE